MIWEPYTLLMVDRNLLSSQSNASFIRETAFKYDANPLMTIDDKRLTLGGIATSIQFRLIHKVDGVYRLWYSIWANKGPHFKTIGYGKHCSYAYAESTDGLSFKPVNLNQVTFNGNKRNNLIDFKVPSQPDASLGNFFVDPLDKAFPYKCVYYRSAKASQIEPGIMARMEYPPDKTFRFVWGIGKSSDGKVWLPPENKENLINADPETARIHRDINGNYVISDQMMSSVEISAGRAIKGWISKDGITSDRIPGWVFDIPQHMGRIYPEFSGVACKEQYNNARWVQPHVGLTCARKGPTILALHGYLYYAAVIETFAQTADIGLCVSSSGVAFREVLPMRPFIPTGPRGSWDYGMVAQGDIIDDGDQTRFYYTGNEVGNLGGHYAIGMAYIPRDRYGYQMIHGHRDTSVKPRSAQFFLKPVEMPAAAKLAINVSHLVKGGSVRLQIADENNKPIPGFAFADCKPITRESLRKNITWKSDKPLSKLAGKKVCIGVTMDAPKCGAVETDSPRVYAVYLK